MRHLWLLGPACVDRAPETQKTTAKSAADERDAGAVPRFRSRRTVALLGYLVAERRSIARDFLATLFWPDEAASKGRSNLRRELHNLAQILPDCWQLDRQAVAFVPSADVEVDIYTLQQLEAQAHWQEAADLLRGEFLEGLYLDDNLGFETWLLGERERWLGRAEAVLTRAIEGHMRRGQYSAALRHTQRLLQLAPWNEGAHRQAMRLLAWTGRRGASLRQFETCKRALWEHVSVEPASKTIALWQQIQAEALDFPPQLPTFLTEEGARHEVDQPLFVARERKLAQLDTFLSGALAGQSRVVFVTGGPGRGKTALLGAFARQAMEAHPDLLVASGNGNAYSDVGDPYLPFRDVMAMLTGDVEGKWDAGAITRDHAQRLWSALPLVAQALLDHGPHLLDVLVPGAAFLSRAAIAVPDGAPWLPRLRAHVSRQRASAEDVEQSYLFQQVTDVLRAVAREQPLLLLLDDLQWADVASVSLLFHLGRRLTQAGTHVLIVCAYRPEEVGPVQGGEHHPLEKVLREFRRTFGDVWVDLDLADQREGRRFVDAFLDTEPNRLGEEFRAALFHRTAGHPLFTIELLRSMQERGDLLRDEADSAWMEGPGLDWQTLPARVEAAIEARIDHLEPRLRQVINVASVEGEQFTAEVLAAVQGAAIEPVLQDLRKLERVHQLVREQGEVQVGSRRAAVYKFGHILIQEYLYQRFGQAERRRLHGQVAAALEHLHRGNQGEIAIRLAHHFLRAGDDGPAFHYSDLAAERAARRYAHEEAITLHTQALELAARVAPDVATLASLHRKRGLARETLGRFEQARADYETARQVGQAAGKPRVEWRALLDLARLWGSRDYGESRGFLDEALDLARHMGDPAVYARSLNRVGNWHTNADNLPVAIEYHRQALAVVEQVGDPRETASTLDHLGLASLIRGDFAAGVEYYERAILLWQRMDDQPGLAASLTGRGLTGGSPLGAPTSVSPPTTVNAHADLEQALRIARDTNSPSAECWALWSLGLLHAAEGQYGRALETVHGALSVATSIGHREWMAGTRSILGELYVALFAAEEAQLQLRQALALAERLHSQHWIHHATGALAAACFLCDDLAQAEAWLDTLLSPGTPMDSIHKRTCWARRAELALLQGRAPLALEIAERLIASAPGMAPGKVISYLWQLKAKALAAMGQPEDAASLLQAAMQHAQVPGARFLLWRLHASLGHVHSTMGQAAKAEAHFAVAQQLVAELADTIPVQDLRDGFVRGAHRLMSSP